MARDVCFQSCCVFLEVSFWSEAKDPAPLNSPPRSSFSTRIDFLFLRRTCPAPTPARSSSSVFPPVASRRQPLPSCLWPYTPRPVRAPFRHRRRSLRSPCDKPQSLRHIVLIATGSRLVSH